MRINGYRYVSTDITQAFYITQNHLWEGLFPGAVKECTDSLFGLNKYENNMVHIPYWKLWDLKDSDLEADIIVANHCLAEMHERSLRFYLQYGKQLLRNSKYKLLFAQATGYTLIRSWDFVMNCFNQAGYELVYRDHMNFCFCLRDMPNPQRVAQLLVNDFERMKTTPVIPFGELNNRFLSIDKNIDTPDEEFVHYIGLEKI